jgi:hypothetical protein
LYISLIHILGSPVIFSFDFILNKVIGQLSVFLNFISRIEPEIQAAYKNILYKNILLRGYFFDETIKGIFF